MIVRPPRGDPALSGAGDHPLLQQVRLDDVHQRVGLFAHARRDRLDPGRAAGVELDQRPQQAAVLLVEPAVVNPSNCRAFRVTSRVSVPSCSTLA